MSEAFPVDEDEFGSVAALPDRNKRASNTNAVHQGAEEMAEQRRIVRRKPVHRTQKGNPLRTLVCPRRWPALLIPDEITRSQGFESLLDLINKGVDDPVEPLVTAEDPIEFLFDDFLGGRLFVSTRIELCPCLGRMFGDQLPEDIGATGLTGMDSRWTSSCVRLNDSRGRPEYLAPRIEVRLEGFEPPTLGSVERTDENQ